MRARGCTRQRRGVRQPKTAHLIGCAWPLSVAGYAPATRTPRTGFAGISRHRGCDQSRRHCFRSRQRNSLSPDASHSPPSIAERSHSHIPEGSMAPSILVGRSMLAHPPKVGIHAPTSQRQCGAFMTQRALLAIVTERAFSHHHGRGRHPHLITIPSGPSRAGVARRTQAAGGYVRYVIPQTCNRPRYQQAHRARMRRPLECAAMQERSATRSHLVSSRRLRRGDALAVIVGLSRGYGSRCRRRRRRENRN